MLVFEIEIDVRYESADIALTRWPLGDLNVVLKM